MRSTLDFAFDICVNKKLDAHDIVKEIKYLAQTKDDPRRFINRLLRNIAIYENDSVWNSCPELDAVKVKLDLLMRKYPFHSSELLDSVQVCKELGICQTTLLNLDKRKVLLPIRKDFKKYYSIYEVIHIKELMSKGIKFSKMRHDYKLGNLMTMF